MYFKEENNKELTTIEFEKEVYDIGDVPLFSSKEIVIRFSNIGQYPLKIYDVKTSCGCTIVNWDTLSISSKEIDSIIITFNAEELGFFSKRGYVFSNIEKSPSSLFVEGIVVD